MDVSDAAATLAAAVDVGGAGSADAILRDASVDGTTGFDPTAFDMTFGAAGRRLGTAPVGGDAAATDDAGHTWPIAGWGRDEAGRALLVLRGIAMVPDADRVRWLDGLHRAGGMRERQALLRVLALLPHPERFLAIALDACRTSTQPVFEAIACENPYPAAHFPEPSFNQMVLKAVFTGVPLARILDLERRRTPELARMAADYAAERRAAGRAVPADLARLTDA